MRRFLLSIALGGLLTACSFAPLVIHIEDYDTDVGLLGNSKVVFQKAKQNQTPPTPVKSIAIEGEVTYQQQDIILEFFASDGPPCTNQPISGVYVCDLSSDFESVGEVGFASGAKQSFQWSGSELTAGTNKGSLYLGVRLKSGLLTGGSLLFRNIVAKVVIF
ncbi:hypothetical protein [Calidithermus roseus]|uniref:Lipoprotein n=1 Tax=Calidithermus roseus TaxID=1644118 RepID=A0A399EZM5_9DEIN|nr:hypothetical protein [Calidithermus roseus]RIH87781.1 hypothetical protein Mrose_01176 [Calidithermus roseus]